MILISVIREWYECLILKQIDIEPLDGNKHFSSQSAVPWIPFIHLFLFFSLSTSPPPILLFYVSQRLSITKLSFNNPYPSPNLSKTSLVAWQDEHPTLHIPTSDVVQTLLRSVKVPELIWWLEIRITWCAPVSCDDAMLANGTGWMRIFHKVKVRKWCRLCILSNTLVLLSRSSKEREYWSGFSVCALDGLRR